MDYLKKKADSWVQPERMGQLDFNDVVGRLFYMPYAGGRTGKLYDRPAYEDLRSLVSPDYFLQFMDPGVRAKARAVDAQFERVREQLAPA